jgi:hypothetical protein
MWEIVAEIQVFIISTIKEQEPIIMLATKPVNSIFMIMIFP